MNPCLWEEHGEIPRRGQSPLAGLAAELASCPHSIRGRPAPDSSAVLPDVHADRHAVSTGQLQRLGCDLLPLAELHCWCVVMLAITSPGAKRPAAEPLPGRHRQPTHTAPARLGRHEVKVTGRSDIAAVARGEAESPRSVSRAANPGGGSGYRNPAFTGPCQAEVGGPRSCGGPGAALIASRWPRWYWLACRAG